MTRLPKPLYLCVLLALCLGAGPALADEIADEPVAELGASPGEPETTGAPPAEPEATGGPPEAASSEDFENAEADWEARRRWSYGTQHFFGLSRGMEDAGVPRLARPFLYVVTVPFDTVLLPVAAISGLFGD